MTIFVVSRRWSLWATGQDDGINPLQAVGDLKNTEAEAQERL